MNRILFILAILYHSIDSFAYVIDPVKNDYNQILMPSRMGKPSPWVGEVKVVDQGYRTPPCLLLTGEYAIQQGAYSENSVIGRRSCPNGIVDCFYTANAMVKGTGKIKIGIKCINDKSANKINAINWSPPLKLNDHWQNLTLNDTERSPYCVAHQILLWFEEQGEAYIDDVSLQYSSPGDIKFNITPQNIMASPGTEEDIKIELDKKVSVYIRTYSSTDGSKLVSETKVEPGIFKLKIPEDANESYRIHISVPELGIARNLFVSLVSKKELKAMESDAAKIKLEKPLNILIIGDSLSDYFRGFNYANFVDFLGNKYHPGKIIIRNAAVGGDFITRVWDRMRGADGLIPPIRVRQFMYDDYLNPAPDLIFIFLGANDSKCSTISDFRTPYVTLDVQEKTYRKVLDYLHKKTGAKITLIGCPSFNSNISTGKDKIASLLKSKSTRWLFGIDKAITDFNSVNKKLAAEYKIDFIELFDITVNSPEKEKLYQQTDGVHLTEKGNRIIAAEILKYIANKNIKTAAKPIN